MEKIIIIESKAVSWLEADVNTDIITPMKRLLLNMNEIEKYAFEPYRYMCGDGDSGCLNPEFPLNLEKNQGARILITGDNFGCGSSRETAPEAIKKMGFDCLVGSTFGSIFKKNCIQQGVLPISFERKEIERFAVLAELGKIFKVNLQNCTLSISNGECHSFFIDDGYRYNLMNGLTDVDNTLKFEDEINAYFDKDRTINAWKYTEEK